MEPIRCVHFLANDGTSIEKERSRWFHDESEGFRTAFQNPLEIQTLRPYGIDWTHDGEQKGLDTFYDFLADLTTLKHLTLCQEPKHNALKRKLKANQKESCTGSEVSSLTHPQSLTKP